VLEPAVGASAIGTIAARTTTTTGTRCGVFRVVVKVVVRVVGRVVDQLVEHCFVVTHIVPVVVGFHTIVVLFADQEPLVRNELVEQQGQIAGYS
jgi:hypothetical protein